MNNNLTNCDSCSSCDYCYSCNYCYHCDSCNSCSSCYYCYSCNYCDSCNSCDYCNHCSSCDYCYSCDYCDYCDYCKGLRMSEKMIFCVGEGRFARKGKGYQKNLQIFNKDVSEEVYENTRDNLKIKNFKLPTAKWIDIKDIDSPTNTQRQLGGYLKTLSYEDAWEEMWNDLSTEDKTFFSTLPNFDPEIFEEITGIKYDVEDEVDITVDGKTTRISRKSAKALGLIK